MVLYENKLENLIVGLENFSEMANNDFKNNKR